MIITHRHLRAFKYCNNGARKFFKQHNLNWSNFVTQGLPDTEFIDTGDDMAIKLVEFAKRCEDGRG